MTEQIALNVLPQLERPPQRETPERASTGARVATLVAVIVPFLGLVTAVALLWDRGLSWVELALLAGMYALTGVGVTVGFHRLFTHRAFETNRAVQAVLAVLGSMAVQGPLLRWVADHRRHHQHSDQRGDPHSPHQHGRGFLGLLRGLWHAHVGWFFTPGTGNVSRYVKDLRQSALLRTVSALFPLWVVLGLLLPTLLGWLLLGGWTGAGLGLLWGGLVRVFFIHHVTWSINSVCHMWGRQPFGAQDESRNNFLFGVLGLGEGWHNNHHAFPTSARHGFRWWQLDASYAVICALALVGLAWNVKLPGNPGVAA